MFQLGYPDMLVLLDFGTVCYDVVATLFLFLYLSLRRHFMCYDVLRNVDSCVCFTHMASLIGNFLVGNVQRSILVGVHQRSVSVVTG